MVKRLIRTREGWWALPLRVSLGVIFIAHGGGKLFGLFGRPGLQATAELFATKLAMTPGLLWATLAGCGEFFGGLLVLAGLATRVGALNIVVVMLVAMLRVHWGAFFLPAGIEFTLALIGSALPLLVFGGGSFSVDLAMQKTWDLRGRRRRG